MIAIFGGSFDPPTLGHLMVVSHLLLNEGSVHKVLVVPCASQVGKNLKPFSQRVEMCRRTFNQLSRVEVSTIESELPPEHYGITLELVKKLQSQMQGQSLRFVMGADLLMSAHTWEGWKEVTEIAPPLIIGRAGVPNFSNNAPSPISPLVSSTLVRNLLNEGEYEGVERYITKGTLEYIVENKLYLQ